MARRRTIDGDEVDAVYHRSEYPRFGRPGVARFVKKKMNKRERRERKRDALRFE